MSQNDLIAAHLKSGRSITPIQALKMYGCFRLGARIYELKRRGLAINAELVNDPKTGKQFARYQLATTTLGL